MEVSTPRVLSYSTTPAGANVLTPVGANVQNMAGGNVHNSGLNVGCLRSPYRQPHWLRTDVGYLDF